jgi:hypothetical protein
MNKATRILGYGFLAFVAVAVASIAIIAFIGHRLDKESKAFVDAAIPAIVSDWDVKEIQKRASPEFDETADYDDLQYSFVMLRTLGDLTEYKGSKGEATIRMSVHDGIVITALYTANADFDAGSAEMQVSLIRHGGQWQILGFRVSPQFSPEEKNII